MATGGSDLRQQNNFNTGTINNFYFFGSPAGFDVAGLVPPGLLGVVANAQQ